MTCPNKIFFCVETVRVSYWGLQGCTPEECSGKQNTGFGINRNGSLLTKKWTGKHIFIFFTPLVFYAVKETAFSLHHGQSFTAEKWALSLIKYYVCRQWRKGWVILHRAWECHQGWVTDSSSDESFPPFYCLSNSSFPLPHTNFVYKLIGLRSLLRTFDLDYIFNYTAVLELLSFVVRSWPWHWIEWKVQCLFCPR